MKVLVGTDFHGKQSVFEAFMEKAEENKADVMVVCGDITHFGSLQEARRLLSLLTDTRIPVLFVPGNCDPPSLVGVDIEGVTCIHGKNVTYDDVTFLGVGASPPTPFSTPFEMTEDKIMEALNQASNNLPLSRWVVLISHSPPNGTLLDKTSFGHHVGSLSVRKYIEENQPSMVFCGHIHEAKGKEKIGKTLVVNPGPARHGDYVVVFLDNELRLEPNTF
ncbi:MAG: metallophosphoesterase [Candidatus Bathyarchaeia archaeon]|nr:metallophosphoesterase family protein [Candidatus Bathyarchaeota archaeon]